MPDRATIRVHAVAVAAVSWPLLLWSQAVPGLLDRFGTLRGVDFLQFYASGLLVANGQVSALYDWDGFARLLRGLVPAAGDVLFLPVYPPQVALLFAPFARLPYLAALAAWVAVSAVLCALSAAWLWRSMPSLRAYRREGLLLALAFPPVLQLLAHGQLAGLALPLVVLAWRAWKADRPFWCGVALGSLVFKPQLGLFAAAALALRPDVRLAAGLAAGGGAQLLLVAAVFGPGAIADYLQTVSRVMGMAGAFEPKPWQMHSLRGAFVLLLGHSPAAAALWIAGSAGVIWLAVKAARRHASAHVRFALVGLAALVLNPHLYVYDLILLAVPLACLAAWLVQQPPTPATTRIAWLTYALVWLPLIGPLALVTRIQLTAPAMVLLIWQIARDAPARSIPRG